MKYIKKEIVFNSSLKNAIFKTCLLSDSIEKIKSIGFSMEPIINQNDILGIHKEHSYNIGHIILFEYENKLLVHRIIDITNKYVICKGDNAFRLEYITEKNILGKVVEINGDKNPFLKPEIAPISKKIGEFYILHNYDRETTVSSGIFCFLKQYLYDCINDELIYNFNKLPVSDSKNIKFIVNEKIFCLPKAYMTFNELIDFLKIYIECDKCLLNKILLEKISNDLIDVMKG